MNDCDVRILAGLMPQGLVVSVQVAIFGDEVESYESTTELAPGQTADDLALIELEKIQCQYALFPSAYSLEPNARFTHAAIDEYVFDVIVKFEDRERLFAVINIEMV